MGGQSDRKGHAPHLRALAFLSSALVALLLGLACAPGPGRAPNASSHRLGDRGDATKPLAQHDGAGRSSSEWPAPPALFDHPRALTFAGRRSGEGYFDADGEALVFQSEREPGNPFDQIYRMTVENGETRRLSPGIGRATCGFFHPDGRHVLFASTHADPGAERAQVDELERRASGRSDRYAWNFDPAYDLYLVEDASMADARTAEGADRERVADGDEPMSLRALVPAPGYDAEGSISPDGRFVVFASNRHVFESAISDDERERRERDPAYFVDLYRLELASGDLRRLTHAAGYDGGPFFSPDGGRIVFRRFSPDGLRAEILSIDREGGDERTLTRLGAMSWAPFYHPSGDYVIFATNRHGFDDFELYLVDVDGEREPVRVTDRRGFDGLPAFSPSGDTLVWTSNATPGKKSQLFRAEWNDAAARRALGLASSDEHAAKVERAPSALASDAALRAPLPSVRVENPDRAAPLALPSTVPEIRAADFRAHVAALTDPRTEGRATSSAGEALAADYVARALLALGLSPAGDAHTPRHRFDYTAGIALGADNHLTSEPAAEPALVLDTDWRPLAFSRSGEQAASPVVFAGYGLVAPAEGGRAALDEYAGLDVKDRFVLVLRDLPADFDGAARQSLALYASLRHKAMIARDRGAAGILFVNGPRGGFREALVPLRFDAAIAGSSLVVASVRAEIVEGWLRAGGRSLEALERAVDAELVGTRPSEPFATAHASDEREPSPPRFELPGLRLAARVDLETLHGESSSVVLRLQVGDAPSRETVVLGAHLDHLGRGRSASSLADASEAEAIHPGADDNASGVAVLLEIAEGLAARRAAGESIGRRDFVFAAWSGEELGLLGSDRWAQENVDPHTRARGPVAYLNFDMVGRLDDAVVIHGAGSSSVFPTLLERAASTSRLALAPTDDAYLPTDSTSFYTRGLPVLSAFTGVHSEYHTPRDLPDTLDAEGAAGIAELFTRVAILLSQLETPPDYVAAPLPEKRESRGGLRVFLGTIPDYAGSEVTGVRLSGVAPGGPADAAGVRRGDTIVDVDGKTIENLYDYTFALEALRVGRPARITVLRDGRRVEIEVVPRSRD